MTFYPSVAFAKKKEQIDLRHKPKAKSKPKLRDKSKPKSRPKRLEEDIFNLLSNGEPMSSSDIARALGYETLSGGLKRAIHSLLEKKLIEYTIPDKPKSQMQKYIIKGKKAKPRPKLKAKLKPKLRPKTLEEAIINLLAKGEPMSSSEIAHALEHETLSGGLKRAIHSLLEKKMIEYTIPDKPRSQMQKYIIKRLN